MDKPAKPTGEALAMASASCSVLNLMKKKKKSAAGRHSRWNMQPIKTYLQKMLCKKINNNNYNFNNQIKPKYFQKQFKLNSKLLCW